jgi:GWxTD domain-containing protein
MTTFILFSHHPLIHALGWSLLHFLWQGTVIAILLASVQGLARVRSPQIRYAASCCALALMVILPLATFARLAAARPITEIATTSSSLDRSPAFHLDNGLGTTEPWLERVTGQLDRFVPWILSVWGAGVILLLGRLNLGLMAVRRMKSLGAEPVPRELQFRLHQLSQRLGVEQTVKLANSALVQVPTVIGWLRPVILIPVGCLMGLSPSQVEAVLAHELAHIRRHDYLVSVFQSAVEALLFYHPAVWWVSQQIRREREHCCDDLAVRISGDSLAYAKALSFLEERRASVPMVALGANGGVLAMRIRRLLGYRETPVVPRLAAISLLATVFVAVGLCVGTVARAASQQAATENTQGLPTKYQQWLDEDVVWIITPEERAAFSQLNHDAERDEFMKQFWERRNPTPNSSENKAKDVHYQRIKFANAHFATASTPGWKTDRGHVWIVYGPPDEIESHPAPGPTGLTKPTEFWRYHLIQEHGVDRKNVDMTFMDASGHGDYQLVLTPVNPANN